MSWDSTRTATIEHNTQFDWFVSTTQQQHASARPGRRARRYTHLLNGDPQVALDVAEMFASSELYRVMTSVGVIVVSPLLAQRGANWLAMGGGVG